MVGSNKYAVAMCGGPFRRFSLILLLPLLAVANSLTAQEPVTQQGPPLKATVNRVNVGVTVIDSRGRFVSGLRREDFHIYDNDVEQAIADFLPIEEPAQFLLLIESGPSVFLFAKNHVLAADALLASVAPDDQVAIATYSLRAEMILDFTADKGTARLALRSIDFRSGFGDLNLFSSISSAIDGLAPLAGKKTIVLLATGVDTSPNIDWHSFLPKLQVSDVRIVGVSLSGDIRRPAKKRKLSTKEKMDRAKLKKGFVEADASLRQISSATGGRVYFARNAKEFSKAYAEIAELLRHEYSLAFTPAMLDGNVHRLRVEVKRPGVRVDHRPAYLAAGASVAQ
jgi:Ca-activated chloride channel family protein